MARKTKSKASAPPPASTVAAPTVPTPPVAEAAAAAESDNALSEAAINQIVSRNVIGNPPVPAAPEPEPGEAENTEQAVSPETEPTAEAGQESSPAEAEGAGSEENVSEAEQEQKQEDEEQAEEAEAEAAEAEAEPKEGQRDWRQQRIAKLKARNGALREELAEAQAKLQELQSSKEQPRTSEPQSPVPVGHPDLKQLDQYLANQEEVIRWAEENPDGAEVADGNGAQVTYDAAQVRRIKADALVNHSRTSAIREAKAEELSRTVRAQFHEYHTQAAKLFPWMLKKESPEYLEAVEIVRKAPSLLGLPDHELLIGYMVEGKRSAKAKLPKVAPRVAPRVPGLVMSPPNTRVTVNPTAKALKRIASGDEKGVQDYFVAQLNGMKTG